MSKFEMSIHYPTNGQIITIIGRIMNVISINYSPRPSIFEELA
jgi:hypothetical protein